MAERELEVSQPGRPRWAVEHLELPGQLEYKVGVSEKQRKEGYSIHGYMLLENSLIETLKPFEHS